MISLDVSLRPSDPIVGGSQGCVMDGEIFLVHMLVDIFGHPTPSSPLAHPSPLEFCQERR